MCTGIQLKTTKGVPVYARTMEFGTSLHSKILVIHPGHKFTAIGPTDDYPGMSWTSQYAIVGINAMDREVIADGMNSEGLAVGSFYQPGYASYMDITSENAKLSLSSIDVTTWLLSSCSNVNDVKEKIKGLQINNGIPIVDGKQTGTTPYPLHYNIHDTSGNALVIECINGVLFCYDNPIGILTNSPTFDWHMTNLRNYVNISPDNKPVTNLVTSKQKNTATPFGQGSGFLGLPGDFTPPSRFIRAFALTQSVLPVDEPLDAITQAFHILSSFDIPEGVIREHTLDENGDPITTYDKTLWTSACDLKNKKYYFHSRNNRTIRMVDLGNWNFHETEEVTSMNMEDSQQVEQLYPVKVPA